MHYIVSHYSSMLLLVVVHTKICICLRISLSRFVQPYFPFAASMFVRQ
jgi:hypothetical protein